MRYFKLLLLGCLLQATGKVSGQDSVWTLEKCIRHAEKNNLSIKRNDIDRRISQIAHEASKLSYYPTFSLSSSYGISLGRSVNPTTNQFENTQFSSIGLSASSGVLLFGWFQKHHTVKTNELKVRQTEQSHEQLIDDIHLNISTAYLRALLAKEQISNVLFQLEISIENKDRTEKMLEAGKSNILEASQAKSQLAGDSAAYYQALLNYRQALIELKAILNLDLAEPSDPVPVKGYELPLFLDKIEPETIFHNAVNANHAVRNTILGIEIAEKGIRIAKATRLPQLTMYLSSGTNYSSSFYEMRPDGERQLMSLGRQLNNNLSQSIGIGLSIPLFNNLSYRAAIKNARCGLEQAKLANLMEQQQLRQDIHAACTDYEVTLKKYLASESALKYAEVAFDAAMVRLENGLIAHFEYLTEKNNYLKVQNETTALKYDLQFKKMLVDYYIRSKWPII